MVTVTALLCWQAVFWAVVIGVLVLASPAARRYREARRRRDGGRS